VPTSPEISVWIPLISVIVGGVIGIAASFLGPWFIESAKQRNEKRKKRAEKIEELMSAVYEFDHWLTQYRNITAYGDPGEVGVSPLAKIEAIAAVYFPMF